MKVKFQKEVGMSKKSMKTEPRLRWLFGAALVSALAFWAIVPEAGLSAPGGSSVNVRATFAGFFNNIEAKIVGGPYTAASTGGFIAIGKKFGSLDLRFYPGADVLTMWLDENITPGTCPASVVLPASPFSIDNLSFFTYKEVFLDGSCFPGQAVPGCTTSEGYLNLLSMRDAQVTYVQVYLRFKVAGFADYFSFRPNKPGAVEPEFVGIAEVLAQDLNPGFPGVDHWEFKTMTCPITPVSVAYEANVYRTYPNGRRSSLSCDHGDFLVPFQLVLDRI